MNLKFLKIHNLFKKEGIELKKLVFGEIKTADGAVTITYQGDDIMVGEPVFVITDQGEIPAPDGEIALEDGRTVIVEGGMGVVSAINGGEAEVVEETPAEAPVETPMAEAPENSGLPTKEEVERTITEKVRKFEEDMEAKYNEKVEALKQEFNNKLEVYEEIIGGIHGLYEKLCEAPAVEPAQKPRVSKKEDFNKKWKTLTRK